MPGCPQVFQLAAKCFWQGPGARGNHLPNHYQTRQEAVADPLPQALVLTAIVIAFSVLAFAVVLIRRAYEVVGTDDLDKMKDTDT